MEKCKMEIDRQIRANVEAELDFDPTLDAKGIGVAVKDGIVTLSGHVPSYAQIFAAERAAQRVKDVKGVAQDLKVRLPGGIHQADDEIAARAVNVLKWSVTPPGIKVTVNGGWVTLLGEVQWQYQKLEAERLVRQLSGVMGVTNSISLKSQVQPAKVREAIVAALKRNAELEGAAISVKVDGSAVELSGRVKAWYERKMAENAAWAIAGVTEVRDNITL
jgi:osmotically-inducible protein OsmY